MRRLLSVLVLLCAMAAPVWASPAEVSRFFPGARMVGEASYSMLSVPLFNAQLWNESGAFSWEQPFALTLSYERSARASTLINRSIREMSSRGAGNAQALAPLRTQFERCFTGVASGDRITGVSTAADRAVFYHNGVRRCEVRWPNFRRHFFGIWLAGRAGPAARLSEQLRGEA